MMHGLTSDTVKLQFKNIFTNMYIPILTFIRYSFLHSELLRRGTAVHLNQFCTVPVPPVKGRVQGCH